jgi:predicted transcriptional regulator
MNGLVQPCLPIKAPSQHFFAMPWRKKRSNALYPVRAAATGVNARKPHRGESSMNREEINQELGVVEQTVVIEAVELAVIEVELADIEHCCLHGQPVPPARAYRIRVDDKYHEWPKAHITGNQLLHLAGRDGQLVFEVFENFRHGEPELISPHAEANLHKHGVEKFTTTPKTVQVTIDGNHKPIQAGTYTLTELKRVLGVDLSRVLDEVVSGEFKELPDNATVHIKGGEIFISHVRQGQSS